MGATTIWERWDSMLPDGTIARTAGGRHVFDCAVSTPDPATTPTGRWAPIYADRLALAHATKGTDWENFDPEDARAIPAWNAPFGDPEADASVVEDREISGPHGPMAVRIHRPAGETSGVGLVWCHDGAFLDGDLDMPEADLVSRGLSSRTTGVVVSVDYRLCRDGIHHPKPHDDAYAAYRWTRDQAAELDIDPGGLSVGDASAGGCLAGSVALHARDDGVPLRRVLLAYPVAHAVLIEATEVLQAATAQLPDILRFPPDTMAWLNENYLGAGVETAGGYSLPGRAENLSG